MDRSRIPAEGFEAKGAKTKLTLRIGHDTAESRKKHEDMGVVAGWNSSFDCLDRYLAKLKKGEKL